MIYFWSTVVPEKFDPEKEGRLADECQLMTIWSGFLVRNETKIKVMLIFRESSGYGCPFLVLDPGSDHDHATEIHLIFFILGKSDAIQLRWDICYHMHAVKHTEGDDPDHRPHAWRDHFRGCFKYTKEAELRRFGRFSPNERVARDTIACVFATAKTVVISGSDAGLKIGLE